MAKLTVEKKEVGIVQRIVACDEDETEREQTPEYARRYGKGRQQPVCTDGCADWQGLIGQLKEGEPDVAIVTQSGVTGMDIITSVRLSPRKCIWFSGLDLTIQVYRLCLGWFGTKPVTYGRVEQALSRCMGDGIKAGNTWK